MQRASRRSQSVVWITPPEIIDALGPFDLDPCAATRQPWRTAERQLTVHDDGLSFVWEGFVWCNPPFGSAEIDVWMRRLAEHGDGVALVPAHTETGWFVDHVWRRADAVLFLAGRPTFYRENGVPGRANSGRTIVLVGYGSTAVERLLQSGLPGSMVTVWDDPSR